MPPPVRSRWYPPVTAASERVGAGKPATQCGLGVFVAEPAEPVVAGDLGIGVDELGKRPQRTVCSRDRWGR
jgi:hypothetical protein